MSVARLLAAVFLGCISCALAVGQCTSQQSAVASLQSRIKTDQNRIRQLNPGLTANELGSWANAAQEERRQILIKSLENGVGALADGLLSAPKNALKPMDIAGYHLPNGIGSLGTGQANAIIGRLEAQGVSSNTAFGGMLISSIRRLSLISGKKGTLEYLDTLSRVASSLKDTAEMRSSNETVDNAAAFFQLSADLAGKGNFAVVLGKALFQGGKNEFDAYMISRAVGPLANASEAQLRGLKVYADLLQRDVQAVQAARAHFAACKQAENTNEALKRMHAFDAQILACVKAYSSCISACSDSDPSCGGGCITGENVCVAAAKRDDGWYPVPGQHPTHK